MYLRKDSVEYIVDGEIPTENNSTWISKYSNPVSDNEVIEKHQNNEGAIGRKKNQRENEILVNLVKQFGLNKMGKYSPQRNIIWIQITQEFNRITGYDWDRKKLRERWKNYGQSLKNLNRDSGESYESLGKSLKIFKSFGHR